MKCIILTVVPLLGGFLFPVTSAIPVGGEFLLERDQNTQEDWIAPSIVSFDFTNAEHNGDDKRSFLDSRDSSTTLSGLAGCLQQDVPGWPKKQPSKEQFNIRLKQSGLGVSSKRSDPTSAQAPSKDGNTLSGVYQTANVVLSNFLTGDDMKKLAPGICDKIVTLAAGIVNKDAGAISSALTLQGGHKKGLSIVHKGRMLQVVGTVANLGGINTKSTLVDLCVDAIRYQAETCTAELKYGSFEHQIDHVAKASTSTWRDASGAAQAIFDFGFAMPGTLN
ncbi:uncharacterized protein N7482_003181 [Penicillium canariense]|uniref:Uncharacterized protein n=1 Tax=Penicillium canariense TaxID=189055 RepID=A0A9W9I844_9EURO|nr:uncharacterized protein N7482_003181 [Penicillium canariense]KAJ5167587.1 hypothetical protein N7482_003181 [Penicillium canariense]